MIIVHHCIYYPYRSSRIVCISSPHIHVSRAMIGDPAAEADTQAVPPAINTQVVQEGLHDSYVIACLSLCVHHAVVPPCGQ